MKEGLTRRGFIQVALAAACLQVAEAAELESLRAEFHDVAPLTTKSLRVRLVLENVSSKPVDVLRTVGSRSAVKVVGFMQTAGGRLQLQDDQKPEDPRLMTRAGPRRVWAPLPPRQRLEMGTYVLRISPDGVQGAVCKAYFTAVLETAQGHFKLGAPPVTVTLPTA